MSKSKLKLRLEPDLYVDADVDLNGRALVILHSYNASCLSG